MEPENQPSRQELKESTDPQQSEMDLNILGGMFQDAVGDTKGRQDSDGNQAGASQTGGVDAEKEKGHS